jgi:hypothetical protein
VLDAARQLALTVFFVPLDDAAQLDAALATVTRERADALLLNSTGPNIVLSLCRSRHSLEVGPCGFFCFAARLAGRGAGYRDGHGR